MSPVETRIVPIGAASLWARRDGPRDAPCIILVAGANASHLMWPDEFCDLLIAEHFSVIRYDHRDTGKSTRFEFPLEAYTLTDLSEDIIAVLDGFAISRAHVVGLSMGGTLVQATVLDHPTRFTTATVLLTAALDVDFAGNIARAYSGESAVDGLPTPRREVLDVLSQRATPSKSLDEELARRTREWIALSGEKALLRPSEFHQRELRAIEHAGTVAQTTHHALAQPIPLSRGGELSQITVPFLIIQGGQDPLNPPPHGRHLASLIPSATFLEIPELGHSLPSSLHEQVIAAIVAHIHGNPGY